MCKIPFGEKIIGKITNKKFRKTALTEHGTVNFIESNMEDHIDAFWGSKEEWDKLPDDLGEFDKWDTVVRIDHGYDEDKPKEALDLNDIKGAAVFRGGKCLSSSMVTGDWRNKLKFKCAFNHEFEASPTLILKGGHWCPECERESWNYGERAKRDPFFAQVWNPLHNTTETRVYPKIVTELDV